MKFNYDLIIIGGGSAGLTAARLASSLGAKVCIVEKSDLGGDCLQYGCVPSKSLIAMNKILHSPYLETLGLKFEPYKIDFRKLADDIKNTINIVATSDSAENLLKQGIDVHYGKANFVDKNTINVEGKKFTAKKFLIATGSHPYIPKINGLEKVDYLTNENIFSLNDLPRTMIIVGGGPIGCELAQAFSLLGTEVTIIQRNERLLPKDDLDASNFLLKKFIKQKISVLLKEEISEVNKTETGVEIKLKSGKNLKAEKILICIGRESNISGLGLEKIGVNYGKSGIVINKYLQSSVKNIYAAGDVTRTYQFTHFAGYQAAIAIRNAVFPSFLKTKFSFESMPWVTFTSPEIAHVGKTEQDLKNENFVFEKHTLQYSDIDRAITDKVTDGFIQYYTDSLGYIVGATITGERAGELIMNFVYAIDHQLKSIDLVKSIFPYPTYSSGIQKLIWDDYLKKLKTNKFVKFLRLFA